MKSKINGKDLIHVAKVFADDGLYKTLLLRKIGPHEYQWKMIDDDKEIPCDIVAPSVQEAIRLAGKKWKSDYFRPLHCGFIYMTPERDEHGMNALFCEMAASLNTPSGIYFDQGRGYNCFVQNASDEAIEFLRKHIQVE